MCSRSQPPNAGALVAASATLRNVEAAGVGSGDVRVKAMFDTFSCAEQQETSADRAYQDVRQVWDEPEAAPRLTHSSQALREQLRRETERGRVAIECERAERASALQNQVCWSFTYVHA